MPLEKHPTDEEKYIYKPREYKFEIQEPTSMIAFHGLNADWVMRITADRRIEVADGVDVTEAARQVLDAMQGMLDVGLRKAVLAEREACADIADRLPRIYRETEEAHYRLSPEPFKPSQFGFDYAELRQAEAITHAIRARGQA